MRSLVTLLIVGLLMLSVTVPVSGVATAADAESGPTQIVSSPTNVSASEPSDDACAPLSNDSERPDPSEDAHGWENGCWYDANITVDRSNGLNQTELDAVIARAMARVEFIRKLDFERTVPVDVLSRTEYQNQTDSNSNTSAAARLHQNTKWEAMLMVNESTDAIAVSDSNSDVIVGGYYSPREGRIVVVSENESSPKLDEIVLSQELFHALQQQHFTISEFDQSTQELRNAKSGIIEGDGNLVDMKYEERCQEKWHCLMPTQSRADGDNISFHWGMYLVTYQPYSDGPKFVENIYDEKGWAGVNAVYENPPASSEQVIHQEKYPDETPANISFTDKSDEEWYIPDMGENLVDYATFGEGGLASMMFYPYYGSNREHSPVVPAGGFLNLTNGNINNYDPVMYGNTPYTAGWNGDRLYPYVTDDSAETGEAGYVWKTRWDSEKDAEEFVDGYLELLTYHNATPVDGREDTYRIADDEEFGDAFYVNQTGDTVYIVNAPTVDELQQVRSSAASKVGQAAETTTVTERSTSTTETTTTPTSSSSKIPGFGALAALVALVGATLFARKRR
jgi:PGF-CTERM protein